MNSFQSSINNIILDTSFSTKLKDILTDLFPEKNSEVILDILSHYYSPKNSNCGPNSLFLPKGYTLEIARDGIYFTHLSLDVTVLNTELRDNIRNYNVHFRRRRRLPRKGKT